MSPEDNQTMNILVCRESRYRGSYGRFLRTCRNSDETSVSGAWRTGMTVEGDKVGQIVRDQVGYGLGYGSW